MALRICPNKLTSDHEMEEEEEDNEDEFDFDDLP